MCFFPTGNQVQLRLTTFLMQHSHLFQNHKVGTFLQILLTWYDHNTKSHFTASCLNGALVLPAKHVFLWFRRTYL